MRYNHDIKSFLYVLIGFYSLFFIISIMNGIDIKIYNIMKYFRNLLVPLLFFTPFWLKLLILLYRKYKTDQTMIQFLGPAKKHVKANVIRSSDNKRQFRVARGLERSETFWHFERLADDGVTIIEETTQLTSYKYFEDEKSHKLFYYDFVALVKSSESKGRVAHYWIDQSDNGQNKSKLLGRPHFLFLRSEDLGYTLYHLDQSGSYQGSTWHPTLEDAREQASYEYEKLLGEWHLLPSKVTTVQDVVKWIEKRGDWARKREGWL